MERKKSRQHLGFYSTSTLRKRGWTVGLIKKHLSSPDKEAINPHYPKGAKMKLYSVTKVKEVERTGCIKLNEEETNDLNVNSGEEMDKIARYVGNMTLAIPTMSMAALEELTRNHYNEKWRAVGCDSKVVSVGDVIPGLKKETIRMLIYHLRAYHEILNDNFDFKIESNMHELLDEIITRAIIRKYAFLAK
ncbi:hypothetical protein JHD46_05340 [Sulfurimonas sp. SAG-AH-194-C20]|nr:hypothetical protein [Sulfurimonas sp. SAG-AH-194-C20]MDF1879063.1 hypothetical protein [Sulfurimonas sp. SAG-AH-194-C20]